MADAYYVGEALALPRRTAEHELQQAFWKRPMWESSVAASLASHLTLFRESTMG